MYYFQKKTSQKKGCEARAGSFECRGGTKGERGRRTRWTRPSPPGGVANVLHPQERLSFVRRLRLRRRVRGDRFGRPAPQEAAERIGARELVTETDWG